MEAPAVTLNPDSKLTGPETCMPAMTCPESLTREEFAASISSVNQLRPHLHIGAGVGGGHRAGEPGQAPGQQPRRQGRVRQARDERGDPAQVRPQFSLLNTHADCFPLRINLYFNLLRFHAGAPLATSAPSRHLPMPACRLLPAAHPQSPAASLLPDCGRDWCGGPDYVRSCCRWRCCPTPFPPFSFET